MKLSLRGRLLVGIIGGMIILLSVFSIVMYSIIREYMLRQFDASLLSTARMLAATVEDEPYMDSQSENDGENSEEDKESNSESREQAGSLDFNIDAQMMPEFNSVSGSAYYQFLRQDGSIIGRSPSLPVQQWLEITEISEYPEYHPVRLPGGKQGRLIGIWFVPRGQDDAFAEVRENEQLIGLMVARDASALYEKLALLMNLFWGGSLSVICLSVGIAMIVIRTGLRPLYDLAGKIGSVDVHTLGQKFDLTNLPKEMIGTVEKLNELLDRLAGSFEREKCFTSDVAHELRTPLAGIRSTLEVALSRDRQLPEYKESMNDCLSVVCSMQGLVNKLLSLARLDSGSVCLKPENLNIAEIADGCWKPFMEKTKGRSITFENRVCREYFCRIDKEYLSMALMNLMENAAEYTNSGGKIWMESQSHNGSVQIRLANTGSSLTQEQTRKVFDRFWRADVSRFETGLHCGLGLALVERIIKILHGRIDVESIDGVFSINISLPTNDAVSFQS